MNDLKGTPFGFVIGALFPAKAQHQPALDDGLMAQLPTTNNHRHYSAFEQRYTSGTQNTKKHQTDCLVCTTRTPEMTSLADRYHLDFAAAFVRGSLPERQGLSAEEIFRHGESSGLRLHKFKRMTPMPRVRRVFGFLRQIEPNGLLDIGSGRGAFLWPLLSEFPELNVHCVDVREDRVRDIRAVSAGGISRLSAEVADVTKLPMADSSFDGVSMLEVLEHLSEPERAIAEAVRVARRFVVVSVPSMADDNPEHIQLFTEQSLTKLFTRAGVQRLSIDYVLNHIIAMAILKGAS